MKKSVVGLVTAGATALVTSVGATPASAANILWSYNDSAGATVAQAANLTVSSDATAESHIVGVGPNVQNNKIASARAGGLLNTGVATTTTRATTNSAGDLTLTGHSHTAGVSLLGGLVKASAIDSVGKIVTHGPGKAPTVSMTTRLIGLTINGKSYAADIKPNTGLTVPGLLSIHLNQQQHATSPNNATLFGNGLEVTLLRSHNGVAAGAMAGINPINMIVGPGTGSGAGPALGGSAYGSYVAAHAGSSTKVESGRTAQVTMPSGGTGGNDRSNHTAHAGLAGVLNAGAITSTQNGVRTASLSDSKEQNTIAGVNLFNGLIRATAISTHTDARWAKNNGKTSISRSGNTNLVNLVIAGHKIPVNVKPNTTIHVANLGTITLNEHKMAARNHVVHAIRVTALHLVLDTARAGLPVGAQVQVSTSQSEFWR